MGAFVGEKNFNVIKVHGTTVKKLIHLWHLNRSLTSFGDVEVGSCIRNHSPITVSAFSLQWNWSSSLSCFSGLNNTGGETRKLLVKIW